MGHLPCPVGRFSLSKPYDPPWLWALWMSNFHTSVWARPGTRLCTLPIGFSLGLNPVKGCVHRSLSFPPFTVRQQPLLEVQASGSWHIHITISSWMWVFTGEGTWIKSTFTRISQSRQCCILKKGKNCNASDKKWVEHSYFVCISSSNIFIRQVANVRRSSDTWSPCHCKWNLGIYTQPRILTEETRD